ncbi:hypothetical protein EYZ11_009777 [Aspergillus tanneri]|uniref:Paramyosin n=1 Tax=Aspergillus tanneri TaxID=1220188 RepID=A0A4S3J711_9EURO|nr:hypothetical protein EYZ11_009777 [Aspergillus tanneri]
MNPDSSDSPASRDPRLARHRPPVRTSLATSQNDILSHDFVRTVSGLVRATIQDYHNRTEKEKLQKQKEATERMLKRAKGHPNFPSTIEYYQRARENEDADLARIDRALDEQKSTRQQLERELKSKLPSSASEATIKKLESEVREAKAETSQLREQNQSLEHMLKKYNDRFLILEKALNEHVSTQTKQHRDINQRVDHLQASYNADTLSSKFGLEVNELKQDQKTINGRLDQLWDSHKNYSASLENAKKLEAQLETISATKDHGIEPLQKRLDEISKRLSASDVVRRRSTSVDNSASQYEFEEIKGRLGALEHNSATRSKVQHIENMFDELKNLQSAKDDLLLSVTEDLQDKMAKAADKSIIVWNEIAHLSNGLKSLREENPAVQQVATVSASLEQAKKTLASVKVGMHSLETRYNNLSTEHVVKNMVVAMQEMYPNVSQLTDQISRLKGAIEKELPPLLAKTDELDQSLKSHVNSALEDKAIQLKELNRLRHDHSSLCESLGPLWKGYNSLEQLPTKEVLEKLQTSLNSLDEKITGFTSSFDTQLKTKADNDVIMEHVAIERDALTSRINDIASELNELISNVAEVRSANTSSLDMATSHGTDIASVQEVLRKVEGSATNKYQLLCKQIDEIWEALEAMEASSSEEPAPRLKKGKRSTSLEDQLQTPKQESPASDRAAMVNIANTSPALALRQQKKKKRPHPSSIMNEERQLESPRSCSTPDESTPRTDETPGSKKKKKKKRKLTDTTPITID